VADAAMLSSFKNLERLQQLVTLHRWTLGCTGTLMYRRVSGRVQKWLTQIMVEQKDGYRVSTNTEQTGKLWTCGTLRKQIRQG